MDALPKRTKIGAKCLVEIWADEEIQWQLSVMGRKQNIWKNIAAKLND